MAVMINHTETAVESQAIWTVNRNICKAFTGRRSQCEDVHRIARRVFDPNLLNSQFMCVRSYETLLDMKHWSPLIPAILVV
jgi:hypothetical protein